VFIVAPFDPILWTLLIPADPILALFHKRFFIPVSHGFVKHPIGYCILFRFWIRYVILCCGGPYEI
jgi:hypothetical protein